jgi:hypothetical protein
MSERDMMLLTNALTRNEPVDALLYTDRPLTAFERELLVLYGCTFLDNTRSTVSRIRFAARDINSIRNHPFVQGVEVCER